MLEAPEGPIRPAMLEAPEGPIRPAMLEAPEGPIRPAMLEAPEKLPTRRLKPSICYALSSR
jgi:hypothetical protein